MLDHQRFSSILGARRRVLRVAALGLGAVILAPAIAAAGSQPAPSVWVDPGPSDPATEGEPTIGISAAAPNSIDVSVVEVAAVTPASAKPQFAQSKGKASARSTPSIDISAQPPVASPATRR